MGFNIDNFKSNGLILGGARPSLFKVIMQFPSAPGIEGDSARASFLIRAAQLPASTVDPIDVPYFGRKIKVAGDRTYPEWTMRIMSDEDFTLRTMFEAWSQMINTPEGISARTLWLNKHCFNGLYRLNAKTDAFIRRCQHR